jgi:hypothetical protein
MQPAAVHDKHSLPAWVRSPRTLVWPGTAVSDACNTVTPGMRLWTGEIYDRRDPARIASGLTTPGFGDQHGMYFLQEDDGSVQSVLPAPTAGRMVNT